MANDVWVTSDIGLNFRDKPGGTLIASLPNGQHLTKIGAPNPPDVNGTVFQQVRTDDGQTGYVAAVYQGANLLSGTNPAAMSSNDVWVNFADGLNLRDKPGGNLLSVIPNGQHLTVLGSHNPPDINGNVFQRVQTDKGQTGYVAAVYQGSSLLSTTQPISTSSSDVWVNSDIGLNFRDVPGGNLIAVLPNGQHLTAIGSPTPPDANGTVFQHVRTDDNLTGYVAAIYQGSSLLSTTKPTPPVSIVPWGKCLAGLGMADQRRFNPIDLSVIRKSSIEAFKIITLGDADETKSLISDLRKINPNMLIVARLFFSTSAGAKFTPQAFVDFCRVGLDAAYGAGVEYFEVHNEPNLPDEGMGGNWQNGAEFGTWLTQVLSNLRSSLKYSKAKWGYPGLSPQFGGTFDSEAFLNGSANAIALCDWIGVHCYWQTVNGPSFPMTGSNDGMYWKHYRDKFPNRLLMITEFSNNRNQPDGVPVPTTDTDKGNQYAQYYRSLRHENNLGAAFSFALSWQDQDKNGEGWILRNGGKINETKIGSTLGSSITSQGLG